MALVQASEASTSPTVAQGEQAAFLRGNGDRVAVEPFLACEIARVVVKCGGDLTHQRHTSLAETCDQLQASDISDIDAMARNHCTLRRCVWSACPLLPVMVTAHALHARTGMSLTGSGSHTDD